MHVIDGEIRSIQFKQERRRSKTLASLGRPAAIENSMIVVCPKQDPRWVSCREKKQGNVAMADQIWCQRGLIKDQSQSGVMKHWFGKTMD
jgi:hypothetical protein